MMMRKPSRRSILNAFLMLPWVAACISPAMAAVRTPRATEGPFYPTPRMRFQDADNDLVHIEGAVRDAGGEIIILRGRVLNRKGVPVEGARIEIWQCDANGRYLHLGDDRDVPRDRSFQGFGHVVTDATGQYAFRTIKPVPYPGRTPHIHAKVFSDGMELTTQFYIAGHPLNKRDGLYRRMTRTQRKAVEMIIRDGNKGPEAEINITV